MMESAPVMMQSAPAVMATGAGCTNCN